MANKKIIAYFMHETEHQAALGMLQNSTSTDSYVMGEMDEAAIPQLKSQGLIVEEIQAAPSVTAPDLQASVHGAYRAQAMASFTPDAFVEPPIDLNRPQFYLVWIAGPLLETWKQQLVSAGAEILEALPTGAYKIRLLPSEAPQIQQLSFVTQLHLIEPRESAPEYINRNRRPPPTAPAPGAPSFAPGAFIAAPQAVATPSPTPRIMHTLDVRLHRAQDAPQVLTWLAQRQVSVAGASGQKIRVYLLDGAPEINALSALPEVATIEEYVIPQLHNDVARRLLYIDSPNPGAIGLTGNNQIVGVADTGIDDQHPDFQGQIAGKVALGRPNDTTDPAGHGTHVAGSIVGNGSASNGQIRGTAPGAKLYFQSLLDVVGGLGGLPLNLGDLFDQAYQAGARIHNNSWGSSTQSRYTFNSSEVDDFVGSHRDMLIVISAGNSGTAAQNLNAPAGFVDWLSICSPASCKNALTVGASRSDRTVGGYAAMTFGTAWQGSFPQQPISGEMISGNSDGLAAFSSRGPCDDQRIKPDVVAPGTNILSTKSSLAPITNFWGPDPLNAQYAYDGGTSMAAPLVSGCAALVREYYTSNGTPNPSAALVKATLINGTRWLTAADSTAAPAGYPSYHQGFGCIDMATTVPNPTNPGMNLFLVDSWQTPANQFSLTGQRNRYQVTVPAGATSLRICFAYTDLPMRALQNNLNLFVQKPDMTKIIGNQQLPNNNLNIPDPNNNVETVRIDNPPPGVYLIQISATNLLKGPQDYALVVTGTGITGFIPIP